MSICLNSENKTRSRINTQHLYSNLSKLLKSQWTRFLTQNINQISKTMLINKIYKQAIASIRGGVKPGVGRTEVSPITEQNYGKFTGFLLRSQKWIQNKERNRQKQETKKDNMVESTITELPRILRGSIQKLDPIWIRTYQIQHHKHQKLAIKRIDKKKQEQQEINNISFKPQVNKKSKNQVPRTLQQYIRDKQQWVKRKNQKIKVKKLLTQASKYEQCIFQPILETKRYNQRHLIAYQSQKVEERLLRSLQKSTEKKASRANKL